MDAASFARFATTTYSVIVCQAGDNDYAQAGGNVCAWAQKRGIVGFVVDGVVRDIGESRENRFPIFGRGVIPTSLDDWAAAHTKAIDELVKKLGIDA